MSNPEISISPYGELLGIQIIRMDQGSAQCEVEIKPEHLNTGDRVHGGLVTSLADTAAGAAVRSIRPEGKLSATTDLNISFIRPPKGDVLRADAVVIHAGRRLYRTEISVYSEDKLVAKSQATFMLVDSSSN